MKKRIFARMVALIITVIMAGALFSACGSQGAGNQGANSTAKVESSSQTAEATQTPANNIDISKKVEIVFYAPGDSKEDSQLVNDELSKMLEKDLNCTLKTIYIPWADFDTKYPLILTTGEKYDLIYTAQWTSFSKYADEGSFLALDDLAPVYAPDVMSQLEDRVINTAKGKDGKIYAIPDLVTSYANTEAFVIRGDFREKYGLPEVTDMASMEAYLDAVKKNNPDIIPYNLAGRGETKPFTSVINMLNVAGHVYVREDNLRNADIVWLTPEFKEYAATMNRWYKEGYFSKSILSNKEFSYDVFPQGKSAVATGNAAQCKSVMEKVLAAHPEWKPEFGSFNMSSGIGVHAMYGMNDGGNSIGKNSENPERALMVLNKIMTDRNYYDTIFYGIKGRNYDLDNNGMLVNLFPDDPTKNGYPWGDEGQWGFRVPKFERRSPSEWQDYYNVILKKEEALETPFYLDLFAADTSSLTNETAAMQDIWSQYVLPLMWGISDDLNGDFANLETKFKAAGSDKYLEVIKKQLNEYLDKINYSK